MSRTPSFLDIPYDLEETLVSVRGNLHYQRILILGVGLVYAAASTFIVGLGFFLAPPKFVCRDGKTCSMHDACEQGDYTLDSSSIHSMVYDWKLVCEDQYQASLIGSLYFFGLILGSLLIGKFTDSLGRQRTCLVFLTILAATLILGSFAPGPIFIDVVSVLSGSADAMLTVAAYLLINEMVTSELRNWYSGLAFTFWSSGTTIVALLFYFFDDWRTVMRICSMLSLCSILTTYFLPESIRWLVVNKKDMTAAYHTLRRLATKNGVDRKTVYLRGFEERAASESETPSTLESGFHGLFSSPRLRAYLLGVTSLWICINVAYFGILMCVTEYNGSVYVNGVLLGVGEAVPNVIVGRWGDNVKRKTLICSSLLFGCVCTMIVWVLGRVDCGEYCELARIGEFVLLFLSMFAINAFYTILYLYTAELFPTRVRSAAFSLCSATARIGGLIASNLLMIQRYSAIHPLLIIAGSQLLSIIPAASMRETLGQPLMDYK